MLGAQAGIFVNWFDYVGRSGGLTHFHLLKVLPASALILT